MMLRTENINKLYLMGTLGLHYRHQPPPPQLELTGSGTSSCPAEPHSAFQAGFEDCVELLIALARLLLVSELIYMSSCVSTVGCR